MENTPQLKGKKFLNPEPTKAADFSKIKPIFKSYINRPKESKWNNLNIPVKSFDLSADQLNDGINWLGHSSLFLKLDNYKILMDPVFSNRVSFVQWAGPKRVHPSPVDINNIPNLKIDLLILSHDHYDHMDYISIKKFSDKISKFIVPKGVKAILISWGIKSELISELNWWESTEYNELKITATPARHFSGRGIHNRDQTLWASYVIKGKSKKIYFCGDSGYTQWFKEIGKRMGPFDLSLMPIGAYSEYWQDIHTNPEEALTGHLELNANQCLPIHWATFDLALHSWDEPIKRFLEFADKKNINVLNPQIGEFIDFSKEYTNKIWF